MLSFFSIQLSYSQKIHFSIPHRDTSNIIKVDIETLIKNIGNYENKWVETNGYVSAIFEDFSVTTPNEKIKFNVVGFAAIWLELNDKLKVSIPYLDGKILTLRGFITTKWKGHMNQYQGVLQDIYFISE